MSDIPGEHKAWVRYLREMVPGKAAVRRYYDDDKSYHLDIFTGTTEEGVLAATIGVMDHDRSRNPALRIHVEILMDSRGQIEVMPNVLSTIGFFIVKNGWKPAPGVVFETMLEMYLPDSALKHVVFVPPFQWKNGMSKVDLGTKAIYPLLAVPITDRENEYIRHKGGSQALEQLWTRTHCDAVDWAREGAV